jgi:hypothetical protein
MKAPTNEAATNANAINRYLIGDPIEPCAGELAGLWLAALAVSPQESMTSCCRYEDPFSVIYNNVTSSYAPHEA